MKNDSKISVSALLCFRDGNTAKELLFVKAFNKKHYGFPGGKIEPGESPEDALVREVSEEINAKLDNVRELAVVHGLTPDGRDIQMHVFTGDIVSDIAVGAEIGSADWFSRDKVRELEREMTPVTRELVMPLIEDMF